MHPLPMRCDRTSWCRFSRRAAIRRFGILAYTVLLGGSITGCTRDPELRKHEFLQSGQRYLEGGELAEATIDLRNALQIDPAFGAARESLALAYSRMGDVERAAHEYVRAADLMPDRSDLQVAAGRHALALGRADDALARAEAVLATRPDEVEAHLLRGQALGGLEHFDSALDAMEEALHLDPGRSTTYRQVGVIEAARGRHTEAQRAFERAVELAPDSVDAHLALAAFHWSKGHIANTERALRAALRLNAAHTGANRAMALFVMANGQPLEAEPHLVRLAEADPGSTALFALTDYYMTTGRPQLAVARLESVAGIPNATDGAQERLAKAHLAAGNLKQAEALVAGLLKTNQRNVEALLVQADLLVRKGRSDEALAAVRAAVDASPTSLPAQFTLGRIYARRGDLPGAGRAFREVLRLNPGATAAQAELARIHLAAGDHEASLGPAEAAAKSASARWDVRVTLVRTLAANGQMARAQREVSRLLQEFSDVPAVHTEAGIIALLQHDTRAARTAFTRALELDPDAVEPLKGLVTIDLRAGRHEAAKARLQRRLTATRPPTDVLVLAAHTHATLEDLPSAEAHLRRAIELDPGALPAYAMLGQLYLSQRRLDQARHEFESLASRQTNPVSSLTMTGLIFTAQGNASAARARFEEVVALDRRATVAANNLAWIYAEEGVRLDEALELAQTALSAAPDVPEVMDTLGWVYYRRGMSELAVPLFRRAVEKQPANTTYQLHLGLALSRTGSVGAARAALERALAGAQDAATASSIRRALADLEASEASERR